MSDSPSSIEERIARLHANGIVDLHFDLLMDLYGKRDRTDVLVTDFLPEFKAGDVDVLAAAIYIEDQYLPDRALAVGLGQIARLYVERDRSDCFVIGVSGVVANCRRPRPCPGTGRSRTRTFIGTAQIDLACRKNNRIGRVRICSIIHAIPKQALTHPIKLKVRW